LQIEDRIMKIIYNLILFLIFSNCFSHALEEIVIKFKIENEIITNKDIENEKKYLISLNNDLLKISDEDLAKISEESIIREKIKKIEVIKYIDIEKNNEVVERILKDLYTNIGMKSEKEFEKYLNKFDIGLDLIKKKLSIEANWNKLIYEKFKNQLSVDEEKIKEKLKKDIEDQKYSNYEYDLSQIVFDLKMNENFDEKYKLILQSVKEQGFKNTSNLYSISENAKIGGRIGWINKTQLSKQILNEIEKIDVGQITKPVQVSGGFLLLKINNKREKKINIKFKDELNKLINIEKNNQYNQFSTIYFNKIKQNTFINEI
tara:strand:- start:4999 stop:5952 length:954 start_codon:yes stop_codon:yes gene_type:complete